MAMEQVKSTPDPEISAITVVYGALKPLESEAQIRVIEYVAGKLGIRGGLVGMGSERTEGVHSADAPASLSIPAPRNADEELCGLPDGINAIAQKWMKRNNLSVAQLSTMYSLGGDEIDLIARAIPGESKRQRMHNVLLLKCVAAYLGGGAARVSHEQLKETCLHYDAFDSPNFAKHLKDFASEVSGTKQSGYTLTQRGLAAATELIKQVTAAKE